MNSLDRRTALVTGGGRGIGRAIAVALAAEGMRVVVVARSREEIDGTVREIVASGGEAVAIEADLSRREEVRGLVPKAVEPFGVVDVLVNNAGVGSSADPRPVVDFDDDFWDRTLEVNLTVPYLLSKAVLPGMVDRGWGRIITIASINGRRPSLHGAAYAASKHGVLGLMRTLALETAADGITVNCICPGPVRTAMNDPRVRYDADRLGRTFEDHERSLTPIGGRLEPEDIAPLAVFLAGDRARMITGQAYNVCGGLQMS